VKGWKTYKLSEVAEIKYGKDHKLLSDGDIPVFGSGGIMRYADKAIYDKESILIPRKGTLSNLFYLDKPFWSVDTMFYTKISEGTSGKFLYYLLKNLNLASMNVGSAVPSLTTEVLNKVEINLPDLKSQKQIASILSSLDNKIELNLQMNNTLEAMAQAIFKEWFVNFNFPGSKGKLIDSLPKGWRMGKLSEVLEIKYGKDYKHLTNGNIPLYGSGGIMKYVDAAIYDRESILIPRKGTLSNLFYTNKPFWSVDTMFYTKIKAEAAGKYLFYLLKTLDLESMNVGSAVPSLTTEVLNNLLIQIPSIEILKQFEVLVTSMHEKLESNIIENQVLSDIRDSILPKLMTGKIEVKE